MSAINDALSQLAEKKSATDLGLQRAEVKPVKQRAVLPWVVGSFALSLCVGGWAISQQAPKVVEIRKSEHELHEAVPSFVQPSSPTGKSAQSSDVIYQANNLVETELDTATQDRQKPILQTKPESATKVVLPVTKTSNNTAATPTATEKPLLVAKVAPRQEERPKKPTAGEVVVEQVELTPQQLAEKAKQRAKKSLDANNLKDALSAYNEALRYTPGDTVVRKKLSALYYGKGEVRKSVELLQKGISLNSNDESLRLALAKLLMKEQQSAAALTVLVELPADVSVDYLSLRGALAQKLKQNAIALESYQQLVEVEPESGRWWLGLAIQHERLFDLASAKAAYYQAQSKLGLSSQSQQFIRDRLALIQSLEEQPSEN